MHMHDYTQLTAFFWTSRPWVPVCSPFSSSLPPAWVSSPPGRLPGRLSAAHGTTRATDDDVHTTHWWLVGNNCDVNWGGFVKYEDSVLYPRQNPIKLYHKRIPPLIRTVHWYYWRCRNCTVLPFEMESFWAETSRFFSLALSKAALNSDILSLIFTSLSLRSWERQ